MDNLFEFDTIYKVNSGITIKELPADNHFIVLAKKHDLENGGREKLLEILNAIGWKQDENCSLLAIENERNINLASYLVNPETTVITFGLSEKELSLQAIAPKYAKAHFENARLVRSDSIQQIRENKQLKIQLWNSIKDLKA